MAHKKYPDILRELLHFLQFLICKVNTALPQFVGTTAAMRDGGFILCQVPPSVHYSHFPHNGYVAFWQGGVLWFLNFDYSIWPNLLSRLEDCFGLVSLSNHQVPHLEGHFEGHFEEHHGGHLE